MKLKNEILEDAKKFYLSGNSARETQGLLTKRHKTQINPATITKRFRKLKIIRNYSEASKLSKRKHLPINQILLLYTKKNYSLRKIAKIFNSRKETIGKILRENGIRIRSSAEVRISQRKYKRIPFNRNECEKAYLIGFVKGDITVVKKSDYTLRLVTNSTVRDFIDLFVLSFAKYGKVKITPNKKKLNEKQIRIDLDLESFAFLLNYYKNDNFILNFNKQKFFSFLSGFIDADGSIMIKKKKKYLQFVIRVYNENLELLEKIQQKLGGFGFKGNIHRFGKKGETRNFNGKLIIYRKDYFALEISNKQDIKELLKKLNIKHKEKAAKSKQILSLLSNES